MAETIEAIYERGVLRLLQPLELAEGTELEIILLDPNIAALREAMNEPLFQADLREVMEDFRYVDSEIHEGSRLTNSK